jgi:hypothetical protein
LVVADILLLLHLPRQLLARPEVARLEAMEAEQPLAIRAAPEIREVLVQMEIRAIRVVVAERQPPIGREPLHLNNLFPIHWVLAAEPMDKLYLIGASNEDSVYIHNL